MTLNEKVGQLFVVGFDGLAPTKALIDWITAFRPGGVVLFGRNIKQPLQLHRLTTELQSLVCSISPDSPLFICVDQEGGKVSRLPPPFTQFPGNETLGLGHPVSLAYAFGEVTAKELRAVGCNMNLAPVLDVLADPANTVIGQRSFGSSPILVSEMGLAVVAGLQDHGVIACGKHFPGHGDADADSHTTLPTVTHGLDRLREVELRPFVHAINNGLDVLMTAHVVFEKLDPRLPATLSPIILTQLLRDALHFNGLVMSDDLGMRAITAHRTIEDAAVKAIQAGVDLILIAHDRPVQERAKARVIAAVKDGTIPEERLEASLSRIRRVKDRFLKGQVLPTAAGLRTVIGAPRHRMIAREILERGKARQMA